MTNREALLEQALEDLLSAWPMKEHHCPSCGAERPHIYHAAKSLLHQKKRSLCERCGRAHLGHVCPHCEGPESRDIDLWKPGFSRGGGQ